MANERKKKHMQSFLPLLDVLNTAGAASGEALVPGDHRSMQLNAIDKTEYLYVPESSICI